MVLTDVARQTGVYTQTLRRAAKRLFGRTKGEFTDAEVDAILESFTKGTVAIAQWNKRHQVSEETRHQVSEETGKSFPSDQNNKSIHLDSQLIVSIDRLLQFKIPHWKDYDKHLQVLSKLLHEVSKKGAEQYERDLIEAQQLAEEYNQWLDEQIEGDYLGGFQTSIQQDAESLSSEGGLK